MFSGIILADSSDHFPIFCMSNNLHIISKQAQPIMKREISENNMYTRKRFKVVWVMRCGILIMMIQM